MPRRDPQNQGGQSACSHHRRRICGQHSPRVAEGAFRGRRARPRAGASGLQMARGDRRCQRAGDAAHLQLRRRHDRGTGSERRRCGERAARALTARPSCNWARWSPAKASRALNSVEASTCPGRRMSKKRVAVLISGRGSNMTALIEAAKADDYPAEIALVVSNRPEASGLARAREEGITTAVVDHQQFGEDREGFERALDDALARASDRFRLPRRLHAAVVAVVCAALERQDAQHPSGAAAAIQRAAHAPPRAASRRQSARRYRSFRRAGNGRGTDRGAGIRLRCGKAIPKKRLPRGCLEIEHRIYPRALRALAEGRASIASSGEDWKTH